jgi:hypothetical protein
MDYKKIYDTICERGKNKRNLGVYVEKHHIIPKCMGGDDSQENLTILTYREHFIAHRLLCAIYKEHRGVNYAFLCMLRKQPTGERILNSRMVEVIKKKYKSFKKMYCTLPSPGKSQKSRDAAKKRMLERNPISLDPSKNRTAQPIVIHFMDGRTEKYAYAKLYCIKSGISYATMKSWLRNGNSSKKHGILKIERINVC